MSLRLINSEISLPQFLKNFGIQDTNGTAKYKLLVEAESTTSGKYNRLKQTDINHTLLVKYM